MPCFIPFRFLSFFLLIGLSGITAAAEVKLSHKGLTLNADLSVADGRKLADGVVLITHGALAHRDMETIAYLRKLLNDSGHSTLAINLSLGLTNRHGMYDCKLTHRHRNDDAVDEIRAWLEWLKKQGARKVVLLGHSRGGSQTALFAAERDHALVQSVVLLAPAIGENTSAATYQQRFNKPLAPVLEQARGLIKAGKGTTVISNANLMTCQGTPVTAESFVSYYGQEARVDTPSLLPRITKPVLVVAAGDDEIVVGLEKKVEPLVDNKRIRLKIVDGADHMFRDLFADEAVEAIVEFLKET